MPELPDVVVYVEHLAARMVGQPIVDVRLRNPFFLRSVDPSIAEVIGAKVQAVRRLGKRIVIDLPQSLHVVIHLMIAGRFRWLAQGASIPARLGLAAFDLPTGTLLVTEAGTKRRASLHLVRGQAGLSAFDRGGLEVLSADLPAFEEPLARENHTLKRALTDPRLYSGIGNAYSDEILHRARLSPVKLSQALSAEERARLYAATRAILDEWTERLRAESRERFPEKVTAFRPEMAVHGRYRQPCPVCGARVQRIRYAENETNYCPKCQTGGKLLADRALSRLLRGDWPKTPEELEERKDTLARAQPRARTR